MMDQRPAAGIDTNVLIERVRRLFTLDTRVFEDVRMDRSATIPAIIVAAGSLFLFALGGWLWWVINAYEGVTNQVGGGEVLVKSVIIGTILGMIFWAAWVGITYIMLSQMFRARVDLNDLIRVMGFAAAPLGLGVLMFIPWLDFGIALAAVALLFGTNIIAVQTVTDAPPGRVLAATGAGFLLWAALLGLFVTNFDSPYGPGIFLFDTAVEGIKGNG
jgi:hypothetical protein